MRPDFSPFPDLAGQLLPHSGSDGGDAAHDRSHLLRVWRNVQSISAKEGGQGRVLVASTILHDCVAVEKNSPLRSQASRMAADRARAVLMDLGWPVLEIDAVSHAIEAHSFSAGVEPHTLEARILQDADRLDALGFIGVARCFYVSGRLERPLYDPEDPAAEGRDLDDSRFTLDHFQTKLLHLADGFRTQTGRELARERQLRLEGFYRGILDEIGA